MAVTTEPPWINQSSGIAARNGTSSHTISFGWTAGTGTYLVVFIAGSVTNTGPGAPWSEPQGPVSSAELSMFVCGSASGQTSITVTHNGSDYAVPWAAYEFPAGTTLTASVSNSATADTFPALGSLPGTEQVILAARGRGNPNSGGTASTVWTSPWVEDADRNVAINVTDGAYLTVGHQLNVTATSITPAATGTYSFTVPSDRQHIVAALNVAVIVPPGPAFDPAAFDAGAFYTADGTTVSIGLASEADTALALTRSKEDGLGLASSTETAPAVTRAKLLTLGLATETSTAPAVTRTKAGTLGLTAETDTSAPLVTAKTRTTGLAVETDSATAVSISTAIGVTLGVATETDTAAALVNSKAPPALGLTTETDTAPAVTRTKSSTVALATEADTAPAVTRAKASTVGLASEADTAAAVTRTKSVTLGLALEADSALAISLSSATGSALSLAIETDTVPALIRSKAITLGLPVETETASPVTRSKARTLGQALEADTAHDISVTVPDAVVVTLGLATSTHTAQPLVVTKARAVALASETDTAQPLVVIKSRPLGLVIETSSTLAPSWMKAGGALGLAVETETALQVGVFTGPLRDLDLTLTLHGDRYAMHAAPDRYRAHLLPDRYDLEITP